MKLQKTGRPSCSGVVHLAEGDAKIVACEEFLHLACRLPLNCENYRTPLFFLSLMKAHAGGSDEGAEEETALLDVFYQSYRVHK